MAVRVCVANNKGGVGKTTVTIALAEALANIGRGPILIVDLDSQINASVVLSGNTTRVNVPWNNGKSIMDFLDGAAQGRRLPPQTYVSRVRTMRPGRDDGEICYIAGHPGMIWFERKRLSVSNQPLSQVQSWFLSQFDELSNELDRDYRYILFDCPPGFSISAEAVLTRADGILLPVVPTALSVMGLQGYAAFLAETQKGARAGILKTMVSSSNAMRQWSHEIDQLRTTFNVFNSTLGHSTIWASAMDREDGHLSYNATYSTMAPQLEAVVHEFMMWCP